MEISSFSFEDLGLWCWCIVLVAALHRRRYIGRPTKYESEGRLFEIIQMRHIRPSEAALCRLAFPKLRKSGTRREWNLLFRMSHEMSSRLSLGQAESHPRSPAFHSSYLGLQGACRSPPERNRAGIFLADLRFPMFFGSVSMVDSAQGRTLPYFCTLIRDSRKVRTSPSYVLPEY